MANLKNEGYELAESCTYSNGGRSEYYVKGGTAVIIDYDICRVNDDKAAFPYSLITEKQNAYMKAYNKVYRFLAEDIKQAVIYEGYQPDGEDFDTRVSDRGDTAEPSPLEMLFEDSFTAVYGADSIKYLNREYSISDFEGNNYFLDYYISTASGNIAVEENGVTYHHPQIIGEDRYRRQLYKQNLCTKWDIRLYRFSTEDCRFKEKMEDDIRTFIGDSCDSFEAGGLIAAREVTLYEHQENCLEEIAKSRRQGKKAFLVVLPTASGKSKIVEEDIKIFAKGRTSLRVLVMAPNLNIVSDWKERITASLPEYEEYIDVVTFAYMSRNYSRFSNDYYNYIVIDEAHHAVAPVLKRVIQHFTPEFMIGITATDQRPDRKKLESVFGSYRTGLSLQSAMEKGIIAQARVYRVESNVDLSSVRINGREYVNADLEKNIRVVSRNELIADVIEKYFKDGEAGSKQGLVFCVNTAHTREMAKLLNERGISAAAYSSKEKNTAKIMSDFKDKKTRFLCACSMISEGWDYPELGIIVMARPTLSKVLYLQQVGRGLRKTENKSDVYIIDVVDEYGAMVKPCSMHSIFQNALYVPFAPVTKRSFVQGELIEIDGIHEYVNKITEIDIDSFDDKFGDYLSAEQLAREFFVSTGTVNSWIKKKKIIPTAALPFGSRNIYLFSPEDAVAIRRELNIPVHDDTTIYRDFFDFLEERDYTLSYKMPFMISLIDNLSSIGEAEIDKVLDGYIAFYMDRLDRGLAADRAACPYTYEYLSDRKAVKKNMLTNPFEKFERKRFMYYSKDLGKIALNTALFNSLKSEDFKRIRNQMEEDLKEYYSGIENKGTD